MSKISPTMAIRLSNIWLMISGSLSVFGMFALQAGGLNNDVKSPPSSPVPLSSKQNEESKLVREALNNPVPGKMNMQIFAECESPLLMQVFELNDHSFQSIMKLIPEKGVNDEAIEMNPVQKGIHSFAIIQP